MTEFERTLRGCVCIVATAVALAGCSGGGGGKGSTQVAAKVNSAEITVHQINGMLAQVRNLNAADVQDTSAKVLERLIDQELLVQGAQDVQLDHDPRVLQLLDAARREILARAYLEQKSAGVAKPSDEEARAYYAANPGLFSERRIYNLQELNVRLEAARHEQLRGIVEGAKSMQDVISWLKAQNIVFTASAGAKAAEQLPIELVPRFAAMKDGQIALIRQPAGIAVVHLLGSAAQPIDEERARPLIEQFLMNQRKAEFAKQEIKRLREAATIAYVGEFSAPSAPPSGGPAAGSAAAGTEAGPVATGSGSGALSGAVERGVAGLR